MSKGHAALQAVEMTGPVRQASGSRTESVRFPDERPSAGRAKHGEPVALVAEERGASASSGTVTPNSLECARGHDDIADAKPHRAAWRGRVVTQR
jgi:hypothetical protein